MNRDVYVIGVGMHRFTKDYIPLRDMYFTAGIEALKDAGLDFRDIGSLYNGYIGGAMMEGTGYAKDLGLTGVPVVHVENASATGSSAFREAVWSVSGGAADVSMALGFDDMARMGMARRKSAPGVPKGMPSYENLMLPAGFFAMWATRRMHDNGTTVETFAKIAAKNWNHARNNPMAQRRADHEVTVEEVLAAPMVAYPHTAMMACASGAGAACAIVATEEWAKKHANGRPMVKVLASQLQSEVYSEGHIFMGAVVGPSYSTERTAKLAYEEAGIGPEDLSLVQIHDAFPIEELMYYELLGICGEGEGDKLLHDGETTIGGRIPFSTDGGLIARGHPGGPTGLAQVWDATRQLRNEQGKNQVENATNALVHMMGAGSVCAVHILQKS
ncbi:MAG: thiolase family protein [Pseudomonadales bacterium]|nr:thiolase family protein [Pseudomonadales bacterium]